METVSRHLVFTGEIEVVDRFRDSVDEFEVCCLPETVSNVHAVCL